MINKTVSDVQEALLGIKSGMTLMLGGFGLCGIPENSIAELDNIISTNEHFAMLAKELKAYILYDDGKVKGAQNILEEILNSPNISQRSNERISNILKTFKKN